MNKLILTIICLTLLGCTATANRIPDGKTEGDWATDEQYCLNKSGKVTGFIAHTPVGIAVNVGGADEKYKNCLKELGWLKDPGDQDRPVIKKEPIKIEETPFIPSLEEAKETGRDGRFIAYDNGTVLDTQTNLMWATKDNGRDINWGSARSYCENYRQGGYTDWRMPTQDELSGLYDNSINGNGGYRLTTLITLTTCCPWTSEIRRSDASHFDYRGRLLGFLNSRKGGERSWLPASYFNDLRVLPVRSGK